jgi:folate-binding protein YgfZ
MLKAQEASWPEDLPPPSGFIALKDRAIVALSGQGVREFLQALITQDIADMAPGTARYGCLLTAQGKYWQDFFIIAPPACQDSPKQDVLWLDVAQDRALALQQKLELYRLRYKLDITAHEGWQVALYVGADELSVGGTGFSCADPRSPSLGRRVYAPGEELALMAHNHTCLDLCHYTAFSMAQGLPLGGVDLLVDQSALLEANFDYWSAISWQKGCYIGQELTARTYYRGLMKRRLCPILLYGPQSAWKLDSELYLPSGQMVGVLRRNQPLPLGFYPHLVSIAARYPAVAPLLRPLLAEPRPHYQGGLSPPGQETQQDRPEQGRSAEYGEGLSMAMALLRVETILSPTQLYRTVAQEQDTPPQEGVSAPWAFPVPPTWLSQLLQGQAGQSNSA